MAAQPDGAAFALAALDDADDARAAEPRHDLVDAEFPQLLLHHAGCAENVEHQFGMAVQVLPPERDFVGELRDAIDDGHEFPRMLPQA